MKKFYNKKIIEQVDRIPIVNILEKSNVQIKQSGRYITTIEHDSLKIYGSTFIWYSRDVYGHTIKFVMEFFDLNFLDAIDYILNKTNEIVVDNSFEKNTTQSQVLNNYENELEQIETTFYKGNVIAYLCESRKISHETVINLMNKKIISQDIMKNAVFFAYDENNNYVGGERRSTSTGSNFRQIIKGTSSGYGVNIKIGQPKKLYVFESAIDMISFFDLFNKKLRDCILLSMGGLKIKKILNFAKIYNIENNNCIICVDNDDAGNKFYNKNKVTFSKRMIPKNEKDWNEYLVRIRS